MRPLRECRGNILRQLKVVLCDIDDTLTLDGKLPAVAYQALERLREHDLIVVPITGRPAGWCDHIARMWPVDGIVGENGAFYFHYDEHSREMIRQYWRSLEQRQDDRGRLEFIKARILAEVPGSGIATDQEYREADLAVDFCEDVEPLGMNQIERIVKIFEQEGATAKISSIHVNGWFGDYDKLTMTRRMFDQVFAFDIEAGKETVAFVGDSPNDEPMFAFFPNAVGVANVKDCLDGLTSTPSWITENAGGFGFAEFADAVVAAKDVTDGR